MTAILASDQPSIDYLKELFEVKNGRLWWKMRVPRKFEHQKKLGHPVNGSPHPAGYKQVQIGKKFYLEHRLIFAIVNGRWPVDEIDHINFDKADNRPENLREATRLQNARNCPIRADNKSGVKGVCWATNRSKWIAQIKVDGRKIWLGYYEDLALAGFVYECAARKYHGEFASVTK